MSRIAIIAALGIMLSACASGGAPIVAGAGGPTRQAANAPPPQESRPEAAAPSADFRPPQIMRAPGLEGVIGKTMSQLQSQFGKARLEVWEEDARKLQFTGSECVLDIYLYPVSPGATPTATHVEARRSSDGGNVDRAACVRALSR